MKLNWDVVRWWIGFARRCVSLFSLQLSVAFPILRYDLHFIKIEFFAIIAIVTLGALKFAEGKRDWFDSQKCFFNSDLRHTPASIVEAAKTTSIWLIECVINKTRAQTIGILSTTFLLFSASLVIDNRLMAREFLRARRSRGWRRRRRRLHVAMKKYTKKATEEGVMSHELHKHRAELWWKNSWSR